MSKLLEKSILSTLVYYDVLGLPLTSFEVHKYLVNVNVSFPDVLDALEKGAHTDAPLQKFIDQKNGFYFLKGRDDIVWQRIRKEKIIQKKWKKAKKTIKLLGVVPFVRMLALSGSMAVGNASRASDIDLLIITKKGRIWTTRLLVTVLLSFFAKKRHGRFIKDRICLNHYITDASLKINFPSLYNAQNYVHLIPVLGDINLFYRFQKENPWIKNWVMLGDSSGGESLKYLKPSLIFRCIARGGELILWGKWGDFVEKILAGWQRRIVTRSQTSTSLLKSDFNGLRKGRITIDDTQLEFHPDSPEARIIEEYNKKMKNLGFPELANEKDSGLI